MQFKTWLNIREGLDFEDMFDSSRPHPKIVTVGEPRQEPYLLELYRGFDVDVNNLQRRGQQHFVLSPEKSDQKLIYTKSFRGITQSHLGVLHKVI